MQENKAPYHKQRGINYTLQSAIESDGFKADQYQSLQTQCQESGNRTPGNRDQ